MKRRVKFVFLIALVSALVNGCPARRGREVQLERDLSMMRQAIDNYTLDKK
jgi:hypothetical protein